MKKIKTRLSGLVIFLAITGLIFAACNTGGDPEKDDPNGGGTAEDITLTDGGTYELGSGDTYPGAEVNLTNLLPEGKSLFDISKYAGVTVNAVLYSAYTDEQNNTPTVSTGDNLAQFTLLKNTSNWDDASNKCTDTKYGMALNGDTTVTVVAGNSGIPGVLLLQANWADFPNAVKFIKVNSITFTVKTSDVQLGVVFGEGKVSAAGNKLTFTDAENSSGAAYYDFPSDVLPLTGKTITVSYTLEKGFDKTLDHQLIIQAANGSNDVNYNNNAQQYIDMNDPVGSEGSPPDEPDADGTLSGSFEIDGTKLEDAASSGGFPLTRIRIVNNGGEWMETGVRNHIREKSYSVTFNSITIN